MKKVPIALLSAIFITPVFLHADELAKPTDAAAPTAVSQTMSTQNTKSADKKSMKKHSKKSATSKKPSQDAVK